MTDWIIEQTVEMTRPTQPYTSRPVELMLPGDHLAHTWRIKCLKNGLPVDLTGYTVSGYFKRMDGNCVLITGSISSNTVSVTLTQECYAYPGSLRGVVRIANADTDAVVTLADRLFFVQSAVDDGGTVDPGEVIPSLADLLAEIDAMATATVAAQAIIDNAEVKRRGLYNAIYGVDGVPLIPEPCTISGSGIWAMPESYHVCFPCNAGDKVVISAGGTSSYYSFITSDVVTFGARPGFATGITGRIKVDAATSTGEIIAPEGTRYLYVAYMAQDGTTFFYPAIISINDVNCTRNNALWNKQMETNLLELSDCAKISTDSVTGWEKGNISSSTGMKGSSNVAILTKQYYLIDPDGELSFVGVAEDYNIHFAYFYNASGDYISRSTTIPYDIPNDAKYVKFTYGFLTNSGRTIDGEGGVSAVAENWAINYISPAEKKNRQLANFKQAMTVLNAMDFIWQNGSINTSTGETTSSTVRIRTPLYNYKHGIKIVLPEGMEMSTRIYSAAGVYEGWQDWASGTIEIELTEEKGYRFVARYTDDSTISVSAGANIVISEIKYTEVSLRTGGKAADARATGEMFAALGIVPYWANGHKTNSGGEILQENNLCTINGYNSGTSYRVMLSGTLDIGIVNRVFTDAPETILLKAGHTYKLKIEHVDGSYVVDEDGRFEVSFGLYQGEVFEPVAPRATLVDGVDIDWKTYTPGTTGLYKIGMMIYRKVTYTDYKVRAVITDITEWVSV